MSINTITRTAHTLCILSAALFATAAAQADRSEADLERDATSKPFQVIEFIGVQPGWTVLDLMAGGGYYSEVLSPAVGEQGKVYLHNNAAYLQFVQGLDERLAANRLPNVVRYDQEVHDIDLPENSVDMVLMVLSYHDLYFETDNWDVTPDPTFAMLRRVLKPGGVLAIVDHRAKPGTGSTHAQDLHRIDADFARKDIEARGFKWVGETDLLENPEDDLTKSVFDESIRRQTSRFVYKFVRT